VLANSEQRYFRVTVERSWVPVQGGPDLSNRVLVEDHEFRKPQRVLGVVACSLALRPVKAVEVAVIWSAHPRPVASVV